MLARFQAQVVDASGDVVPNAQVKVRSETSGALARCYSDRNGTVSLGNPFYADSEGYFAFHTQGGAYRIDAYDSSGNVRTWRYVAIGTAAETDDTSGPIPGAFRNLIIGGDFTTNPWQRGTTFSPAINGSYVADRFFASISTGGSIDILKTADAPSVAEAGVYTQHCLHVDVTGTDVSLAATDQIVLQQRIEGLAAAALGFGQADAQSVTLSFWVKATKVGTYCVSLRNGANDRSYVAEYTVSASDTWEKKIVTIPGDQSGTWLYTNGIGLRVSFTLMAGSNFKATPNAWNAGQFHATVNQVNAMDSTSNNFKLALIKVEAGSVDHDWFGLPAAIVLAQCQRYYRKSFDVATAPAQNVGSVLGAAFTVSHVAAATFGQRVQFDRMRTTPTITTYNPNAANANWRDATNGADRTVTVADASESGFTITGAAGAAAALNYIHWQATAEL